MEWWQWLLIILILSAGFTGWCLCAMSGYQDDIERKRDGKR